MSFKDYSKNLRQIDDEILNANFWNNLNQIQSYCKGILKYFGKENSLKIDLSNNVVLVSKKNKDSENFTITIPRMSVVFASEGDRKKQIYMRSILLRHELAHIIFTNFNNFTLAKKELHAFANVIEDIRIEHYFGKTLKGSIKGFKDLRTVLYNNNKISIETTDANFDTFLFYMQNIFLRKTFHLTPAVLEYQNILKGYENIVYLPADEYYQKINELYSRAKLLLPKQNINKDSSSKEEEPNNSSDSEEEPNNSSDSEEEPDDGSDSEEEESNENSSKEEEEDDLSEIENIIGDSKTLDDVNIKMTEESFLTLNNIKDMDFNENDFSGAIEINLANLAKYCTKLPSLSVKSGLSFYQQIVRNHQAVISDCVRFMKLKIRNRTYNKQLNFQSEGNLDQTNLKEIVINKSNPKAFYRNLVKIESGSRIHIVIDISYSMNSNQIRLALSSAIIVAEVCKRLNIDYGIQFFTNPESYWKIKRSKQDKISISEIKKIFIGTTSHEKVFIDFDLPGQYLQYEKLSEITNISNPIKFFNIQGYGGCLYTIKDINDKHKITHDIIMGNLISNIPKIKRSISRGTPEFESILRIYKNNKYTKRNILFVINDGCFDERFSTAIKKKIKKEIDSFNNIKNNKENAVEIIIYKKLITKMRENGWRVYGIGILSDLGLLYIGLDKFMVIKNAEEIIKTFSKKLREIF